MPHFGLSKILYVLLAFLRLFPYQDPMGGVTGSSGVTFTVIDRTSNRVTSACNSTGVTTNFTTSTAVGEAYFGNYMMSASAGTATISDSASNTPTKEYESGTLESHYTTGQFYFIGTGGAGTGSGITGVKVVSSASAACVLNIEHVSRSSGTWTIDQTQTTPAATSAQPWTSTTVNTTGTPGFAFGGVLMRHSSGSTCAGTSTGSWSTGINNGSGDGAGNNVFTADQILTGPTSSLGFTGNTGTCTPGNDYPGILTVK